jgi:hypothetical protein
MSRVPTKQYPTDSHVVKQEKARRESQSRSMITPQLLVQNATSTTLESGVNIVVQDRDSAVRETGSWTAEPGAIELLHLHENDEWFTKTTKTHCMAQGDLFSVRESANLEY